jgi:hypothetical protein
MTRVNVICEGETEERFVKDLLAPHLFPFAIYLNPILLGRGNSYQKFEQEVMWVAKSDSQAYTTTMIDLYGMSDEFPGYEDARQLLPANKVAAVEKQILENLKQHLPQPNRLRIYVQLHEFEALLFSHPETLSQHLSLDKRPSEGRRLQSDIQAIHLAFDTPEHINDSPQTAPSKCILAHAAGYNKPADGFTIAKNIGLERIRAACPHFAEWLAWLENLHP